MASSVPIIHPPQTSLEEAFYDDDIPLKSIADVLEWEQEVRDDFSAKAGTKAGDRLQEVWFRGARKHFPLVPGIYRDPITNLAKDKERWFYGKNPSSTASDLELERLNLERDMMLTFERESGPLLEYKSEQELYFLARHYGIPSRLLDWSISPLIALFMCVFEEPERPPRGKPAKKDQRKKDREQDGALYAMDPEGMRMPGYICHQNDPRVREAIEVVTMWREKTNKTPMILPIRPHTLPGRVDRQMSRFTLHCHGAKSRINSRLRSKRIALKSKEHIRCQLERIGINEFSVYYTLDRLGFDIADRFASAKRRTLSD